MHEGERGTESRVRQVRVERLQLERGEHALVHDRGGRQAGEIGAGLGFRALAQAVRPPVELGPPFAGRGSEELHEVRHDRPGGRPAPGRIVRDIPPAQDGQALLARDPLDHGHDLAWVAPGGQERHPGGIPARLRQGELALRTEEDVRNLGNDAGAVAGLRVAALGAPVVQVPQHSERFGNDVVVTAAGQVGDEPDSARIVLETAVVQSLSAR